MSVYLDHAATTPMLPAAREAFTDQLAITGNASALHTPGRAARRVVEEARERIAAALGAQPSEVIFTSGGTESDNLAIKGTYAARSDPARPGPDPARRRVVISGVEHHAVLDPVEFLVSTGAWASFAEPDAQGVITPDALLAALGDDPSDVAVVSILWANNEIGTISPIAELAAIAREHGIPMHSDGVQAVGHLPVDFAASGLDLLSLTGHKLGGPLGVGALLARRDAQLVPQLHGGGQERQVRSGTLDVPAIHALAAAVEAAVTGLEDEMARQIALRDSLIDQILGLGLGLVLTGAWTRGSAADRLPGNVHFRVPGADGDSLLYLLDAAGIACATGSACTAGVPRASHVVLALGVPEQDARGSIRMTLGHSSTGTDVAAAVAALPGAVERARRARGAA
ncbi:MAG: cysteine desulfurase family protein [Tetrasphaera sp.]